MSKYQMILFILERVGIKVIPIRRHKGRIFIKEQGGKNGTVDLVTLWFRKGVIRAIYDKLHEKEKS